MTQNAESSSLRKKTILSLGLLVPAPSIGLLCGMVFFPDTVLGKTIFTISKIWLFGLPAIWYLFIERGKLSVSVPRKGGFGLGVLSGLAISAAILLAYLLVGQLFLDKGAIRDKVHAIGLDSIGVYAAGAAYWILVNSVLEEYVWRWFVVKQCSRLFRPLTAILLSAFFFTVHHTFGLKTLMPWPATWVCSFGVFTGGALWSWLYVKYESIWPGYVSHAIVDLCIFGIGAVIAFG